MGLVTSGANHWIKGLKLSVLSLASGEGRGLETGDRF